MPQAQGTVRVAGLGDADLLGDVLADAFADDPVFAWLIPPDAQDREGRMLTFFTSRSRAYLRAGKPCHLAGDFAAAMWAKPGDWAVPLAEMVEEAEQQAAAFGDRLEIAAQLQAQVEDLHPSQPEHWYLGYLGTRRGQQGQGLGSRLLEAVLTRADADRVPAYLESSNERNLTLYERHGFRVIGELKALGRGPAIWRMWREPAS